MSDVCVLLQIPRPLAMKKESIQTRKRKPKAAKGRSAAGRCQTESAEGQGSGVRGQRSSLSSQVVDGGFCPGSSVSGSSSPSSLALSEHASTIKSEPATAPSPYAGQTLTPATQVGVCHMVRPFPRTC